MRCPLDIEEQLAEWRDAGLDWRGKITSNPEVLLGKACVAGTRISVQLILENLSAGHSVSDLYEAYPHLKPGSVEAATAYAMELVYRQWTRQRAERTSEVSRG